MASRVIATVKPGVSMDPIQKPTTRRIIDAAEYVFGRYGLIPTITDVDSPEIHMAGSKHYTGDALDWRRWDADALGVTIAIVEELRYFLGDDYDVVLEPNHLHIEYDPE